MIERMREPTNKKQRSNAKIDSKNKECLKKLQCT